MSVTSTMTESLRMVRNQESFCFFFSNKMLPSLATGSAISDQRSAISGSALDWGDFDLIQAAVSDDGECHGATDAFGA